MSKEQAYEILNKALSTIQTTRDNHALFIKALEVLAKNENKDKESK